MKTACQHAPLRMFMGLQMIGWGALVEARGVWNLESSAAHEWLWPMVIVFGGLWVVATACIEAYVRTSWARVWRHEQRLFYRKLTKVTVMGYFFSGAAWGGIATHAMYQRSFQELDFLCPLYVLFFFYLAFTDASKKRKGVELSNEKLSNASAVLMRGFDSGDRRVHAERAGR